ncbi:DNA (cytosine-5)-methyltransferase DRM2-like protein [Tanacetum coccineum]
MSMPVQMSQAQDGERPQVDDQRLDLADDLKEAQVHISKERAVSRLGAVVWNSFGTIAALIQADNYYNEGSNGIDWNSDDDLEIDNYLSPSSSAMSTTAAGAFEHGESSSTSRSRSKIALHFIQMGFPECVVTKSIAETGEDDDNAILEAILSYTAINEIPNQDTELSGPSSRPGSNFELSSSDIDSDLSDEDESDDKDDHFVSLMDMGYTLEEVCVAIDKCGKDESLFVLIDFIEAARVSKEDDAEMNNSLGSHSNILTKDKKRKLQGETVQQRKPDRNKRDDDDDDEVLRLPNPMIGYGVPRESFSFVARKLPEIAMGPPYFFYENVAQTPRGVWKKIQTALFNIEPEFVDSRFFCVAQRKRGYIHNLPLENRFPLLPLPPLTVFEALEDTREWWPVWDERQQLNCILTCVGSAPVTDRIRSALERSNNNEPSKEVKRFVMKECKRWNMVWIGKNTAAPLEPLEIELIMGYPRNHTRGPSKTERLKGLGNAFQVDTIAYQLSVLKNLYPQGINVLSLFSGIGGAEVALHKIGIPLKNVVCVEINPVCKQVIQRWWNQTDQKGNLVHESDVHDVTYEKLASWINRFGGFDLVIGGSPCNNLAGGNRRTRDGLDGEHSSLFYEYVRILKTVRFLMGR